MPTEDYTLIFASIDSRLEKIEGLTQEILKNGHAIAVIERDVSEHKRTQEYLVEVIKGNGKAGLAERVNKNCASIKKLDTRNAKEDAKEEEQDEKKEERILKYKDLIITFIITNILTGTITLLISALFK